MNKLSAMELLTLFLKSANADVKLTVPEKMLLSVIITYINHKLEKGYEAWPSTDILISKTGLSKATIERGRKSLVRDNWISVDSGKAAGMANHYFINAEKIVEVAAMSGNVHSGKVVASNVYVPKAKEHTRNTLGLMQGKEIVSTFKKQYYGVWYYSEVNYKAAVEAQRLLSLQENLDCPF